MILTNIDDPRGLNAVVRRVQEAISKAFDMSWSEEPITIPGIICYPICYVNERNEKKVIEWFQTEDIDVRVNSDYQDPLDGERNRMIILAENEEIPVGPNNYSTILNLIFIVDLEKTHPTLKHRATVEVRTDVLNVLEKVPNTSIKLVQKKLNKIFGEIVYDTDLNLQPRHCFMVQLSVDRFSKTEIFC